LILLFDAWDPDLIKLSGDMNYRIDHRQDAKIATLTWILKPSSFNSSYKYDIRVANRIQHLHDLEQQESSV